MRNNLVIIGGSGSLIDDKNQIGVDKIYPTLIRGNIHHLSLYNLSKPGNDVIEAVADIYTKLYEIKPRVAIIDLGLVDCSPRVFLRNELEYILSLPESIQKLTYVFTKKYRRFATRIRNKVYVPRELFGHNYRIIIEECLLFCDQIYLVSITRPTNYVCNKSYKILDNIIEYNKIIKELAIKYNCSLIDVFEATENDLSLLANDGYHLSEKGHYFIYNEFHKLLTILE